MLNNVVGERLLLGSLKKIEGAFFGAINLYNDSRSEDEEHKMGLYVSLFSAESAKIQVPLATVLMGELTPKKGKSYRHHAQEKGCRLGSHIDEGHVSSFQSRNEAEDKWPGAILAGQYIISCSGLPWEYDEAACLVAAYMLRLLTKKKAGEIAAISKNETFPQLLSWINL